MAHSSLVWDESGLASHYLSDKLRADFSYVPGGFIGFDNGQMVGAFIFHNERRVGLCAEAALVVGAESPRCFVPSNIRAVLNMAFQPSPDGLGFTRLTCKVDEDNEPSLSFTKRLGFVEEGRHREATADLGDVIILSLLARECSWLVAKEDDEENSLIDNPANLNGDFGDG